MVLWGSRNWRRPASGSLLANWLQRGQPHPDTFVCGLRWPDGEPPEAAGGGRRSAGGRRWQYRRSWVDQLRANEVITMRFGERDTVRVRLDPDPCWGGAGPAPRIGLTVLSGRCADTGARVLLAVPPGELIRFGVKGL